LPVVKEYWITQLQSNVPRLASETPNLAGSVRFGGAVPIFGGIFGEPLPKGHAVRTPMGIIVGGGNEGGNTDVEGFTPRSEILAT